MGWINNGESQFRCSGLSCHSFSRADQRPHYRVDASYYRLGRCRIASLRGIAGDLGRFRQRLLLVRPDGYMIDVPSQQEDRERELGPCFRGIDALELGSCNRHGRGAQEPPRPRSTSSDMDRSRQDSIFLSPRLALRLFLDLQSGRVLPFYANGPSLARMIGRYSATVG